MNIVIVVLVLLCALCFVLGVACGQSRAIARRKPKGRTLYD